MTAAPTMNNSAGLYGLASLSGLIKRPYRGNGLLRHPDSSTFSDADDTSRFQKAIFLEVADYPQNHWEIRRVFEPRTFIIRRWAILQCGACDCHKWRCTDNLLVGRNCERLATVKESNNSVLALATAGHALYADRVFTGVDQTELTFGDNFDPVPGCIQPVLLGIARFPSHGRPWLADSRKESRRAGT